MENYYTFFVSFIVICVILLIFLLVWQAKAKKKIREQIKGLASDTLEMSPEEFFKMRNQSFGGRGKPQYAKQFNFAGVYILFNYTKDMYYVGQAQKVLDRVNNHFTGKGNGDVYADYKYGDRFGIKMISLENSSYSNLNELERNTIMTFDSYAHGYNKTRGNK